MSSDIFIVLSEILKHLLTEVKSLKTTLQVRRFCFSIDNLLLFVLWYAQRILPPKRGYTDEENISVVYISLSVVLPLTYDKNIVSYENRKAYTSQGSTDDLSAKR